MKNIAVNESLPVYTKMPSFRTLKPVCIPLEINDDFAEDVGGRFSSHIYSLWKRLNLVFLDENEEVAVQPQSSVVVNNFSSQIILQLFSNSGVLRSLTENNVNNYAKNDVLSDFVILSGKSAKNKRAQSELKNISEKSLVSPEARGVLEMFFSENESNTVFKDESTLNTVNSVFLEKILAKRAVSSKELKIFRRLADAYRSSGADAEKKAYFQQLLMVLSEMTGSEENETLIEEKNNIISKLINSGNEQKEAYSAAQLKAKEAAEAALQLFERSGETVTRQEFLATLESKSEAQQQTLNYTYGIRELHSEALEFLGEILRSDSRESALSVHYEQDKGSSAHKNDAPEYKNNGNDFARAEKLSNSDREKVTLIMFREMLGGKNRAEIRNSLLKMAGITTGQSEEINAETLKKERMIDVACRLIAGDNKAVNAGAGVGSMTVAKNVSLSVKNNFAGDNKAVNAGAGVGSMTVAKNISLSVKNNFAGDLLAEMLPAASALQGSFSQRNFYITNENFLAQNLEYLSESADNINKQTVGDTVEKTVEKTAERLLEKSVKISQAKMTAMMVRKMSKAVSDKLSFEQNVALSNRFNLTDNTDNSSFHNFLSIAGADLSSERFRGAANIISMMNRERESLKLHDNVIPEIKNERGAVLPLKTGVNPQVPDGVSGNRAEGAESYSVTRLRFDTENRFFAFADGGNGNTQQSEIPNNASERGRMSGRVIPFGVVFPLTDKNQLVDYLEDNKSADLLDKTQSMSARIKKLESEMGRQKQAPGKIVNPMRNDKNYPKNSYRSKLDDKTLSVLDGLVEQARQGTAAVTGVSAKTGENASGTAFLKKMTSRAAITASADIAGVPQADDTGLTATVIPLDYQSRYSEYSDYSRETRLEFLTDVIPQNGITGFSPRIARGNGDIAQYAFSRMGNRTLVNTETIIQTNRISGRLYAALKSGADSGKLSAMQILPENNSFRTVSDKITFLSADNSENMIMLVPPTEMDKFAAQGYQKQLPPIEFKEKEHAEESKNVQPQEKKVTLNEKMAAATTIKANVASGTDSMSREEITRLADRVYAQIEARLLRERRRIGL